MQYFALAIRVNTKNEEDHDDSNLVSSFYFVKQVEGQLKIISKTKTYLYQDH